jgi:3-phenylpropionate/cinnamic acid dioxygenase small subunit
MTTDDISARVQAIEDRQEIADLLVRYARSVDDGDDVVLAACFTDDAEATFAGVHAGVGGTAITSFLRSTMGASARPASTHNLANILVTLRGDEADATSNAVVYGVRGDPPQMRARGVRYDDLLVRTPHGWRIKRRTHQPHWESAATHVPMTPIEPRSS